MFNNLTIKLRLILLISLMSIITIVTNGIGLMGINTSNENIESLYSNKLISAKELGNIKTKAFQNRLLITAALLYPDEASKNAAQIEKNLSEMKKHWEIYAATPSTPEEAKLTEKYLQDRQRYVEEAMNPALTMLKTDNTDQLDEHVRTKIRPLFSAFYDDLEGLIAIQQDSAKDEYEESQARFKTIFWTLIGLVLFGLVISLILSNKIIAGILKSIREVQNIADAVAHGDLTSKIDSDVKDETGAMLKAMQIMQNTLVSFVDAQQVMSKKHADGWIKEQIDVTKFQGSYKTLAESINHLVQSHIDVKMRIVDVVTQYSKGDFEPNMERLPGDKAKITAAMDAVKNAFLSVSKEVEALAAAGAQGDFSKRAKAEKFEFMFKTMLGYLNTFVETSEVGFNDVLRVANALADGDLTQTITKDYPGVFGQVKIGMNNTTENLKNLMSEVRETSETINSAAKEIAAGNNDLSHRTEEQAASLEETAASMHELTSTVEHNSANAKQASELAVGATEIAHKGVSVVEQVVSTMENINESSLRIVDIISVIDDIAFQTNILALNAAVEAARAGEQGKGFAVVATEVRNLAQRAANAAGEIKRLIGDSVERVSGGSKQVAEAGKTMQDIVEAIQNVNKIISEIASASVEQNAGIAQVGQAIGSMDEVTQQNAALVEQVAATAETLESQTSHLAREMAHFKTDASHLMSSSITKSSAKTSSPAKKSIPVAAKPMAVAKDDFGSKGSFSVGNDDWEEF